MTRMTGPDCPVMCNLINTHTVFLPVIYRRGVRYSRCPSLWLLPLSLFDLIAIPLSLLLHFIVLVLALSSYLGCLAPFIYVYGCLSCPTHIICGCPGLFLFLFLGFLPPSESLPGKDVLCRLLPRPLPSVCFLFFFFLFRPCSPPICFGVTSSIVADQLIM